MNNRPICPIGWAGFSRCWRLCSKELIRISIRPSRIVISILPVQRLRSVFPTLLRLAQSHLGKIGGGAEVYYDKMITELLGDVTQSYPARLSLQDQGIFQLGYYHQKQKLFTKKEEKDNG